MNALRFSVFSDACPCDGAADPQFASFLPSKSGNPGLVPYRPVAIR